MGSRSQEGICGISPRFLRYSKLVGRFRCAEPSCGQSWHSAQRAGGEEMTEKEHHSKRHTDDGSPDVESHRPRIRRGDEGPAPIETEHHTHRLTDDGDDDGPDVEAHVFNIR